MKNLNTILTNNDSLCSLDQFKEILISLFNYKQMSSHNMFSIDQEQSFDNWIKLGSDFSIDNVICAFHALIRKNHSVDALDFKTIQTQLSKIAPTAPKQSAFLRKIIWILNDISNDTTPSDIPKLVNKAL